jgi:uncharacterized membrane protein
MTLLLAGLVLFLGAHLFTRARGARAGLIAALGETRYKLGYSLISLLGLVLVVIGWRSAPYVELWTPPTGLRHLAALLVWPAFVLLFAAYLPGQIRAKTRHPMLAAVKLWASAHLIANGDLASVVLFGSLLAWAVAARIMIKRSEGGGARGAPATSWRNDVIALAGGTAAYAVFGVVLHPLLIGKSAFGA